MTLEMEVRFARLENQPSLFESIQGREQTRNILNGTDPRFMMIVGPCSIHDEYAALEYAVACKLKVNYGRRFFLVPLPPLSRHIPARPLDLA